MANAFVESYTEPPEHVSLPSELWIDDEQLQPLHSEENEVKDGAIDSLNVLKKNWSDTDVKNIMKGRGNDIVCEYLSALGQQVRHYFVEGVMFQLIKAELFENASYYRMHKYLILRATTELILEENGIELKQYSPHVDDKMNTMKHELNIGFSLFIDEFGLSFQDLVHNDILQLSES